MRDAPPPATALCAHGTACQVIKNHYACEYIYNAYKDTKTCDIIEEDPVFGTKKVAEPIGVVAALSPTTNPTSTAIFEKP